MRQCSCKRMIALILVMAMTLSSGIGMPGTFSLVKAAELREETEISDEPVVSDSDFVFDEATVSDSDIPVKADIVSDGENGTMSGDDITGNTPRFMDTYPKEPQGETAEISFYVSFYDESGISVYDIKWYSPTVPTGKKIPSSLLELYGEKTKWHTVDGEAFDTDTIITADLALYGDYFTMTELAYEGQSIPEILEMVKVGLDLQHFFRATVFRDFDVELLKRLDAEGYTLDDIVFLAYALPDIEMLAESDNEMDQEQARWDEEVQEEVEQKAGNAAGIACIMSMDSSENESVDAYSGTDALTEAVMKAAKEGAVDAVLRFQGQLTDGIGNVPLFGSGTHAQGILTQRLLLPDGKSTDSWCAKYGAPARSGDTYTQISGEELGFSKAQIEYIGLVIGWYQQYGQKNISSPTDAIARKLVPQFYIWAAANNQMYTEWVTSISSASDKVVKAYASVSPSVNAKDLGMSLEYNLAKCMEYIRINKGISEDLEYYSFFDDTEPPEAITISATIYPAAKCLPAAVNFWHNGSVTNNQWLVSGVVDVDPEIEGSFTKYDADTDSTIYKNGSTITEDFVFVTYSDSSYKNKIGNCTSAGNGVYEYPNEEILKYIIAQYATTKSTTYTFYVREESAGHGSISGYVKGVHEWTVTYTYDTTNLLASVTAQSNDGIVKNDHQTTQITVYKRDNESGTTDFHGDASLDGAAYALYAGKDGIINPDGTSGTIHRAGQLVEVKTIKNGKLTFTDLYEGQYIVLEVQSTSQNKLKQNISEWLNSDREKTCAAYFADHGWTSTEDGRFLSLAEGYLLDEAAYTVDAVYTNDTQAVAYYSVTSHDQVEKSAFYFYKYGTETGTSKSTPLAGAGFTVYQISQLSKADQFTQDVLRDDDNKPILDKKGEKIPSYDLQSILDAYFNENYYQNEEEHLEKYDFRGEEDAIARTYLTDKDRGKYSRAGAEVTYADYYNIGGNDYDSDDTLEPEGNGLYRVKELFSDETGRVQLPYLPYGQYLIVESTTPVDRITATPFILTAYPDEKLTTIITTGVTGKLNYCTNVFVENASPDYEADPAESNYYAGVVNNESIEMLLKIFKRDADTFEDVLAAGVGFKLYQISKVWDDDTEDYMDVRIPMTYEVFYPTYMVHDTFWTEADGTLRLPYLLAVGTYELEEVEGPQGYWLNRKNIIRFRVTSEREYIATGETIIVDKSTGAKRDVIQIHEMYYNDETRGRLSIIKRGEYFNGTTGNTDDKVFKYSTRGIPFAEFTITAAEDIYTQDRNTDEQGNRTVWYKAGEVVAVVKTGEAGKKAAFYANQKNGDRYVYTEDGTGTATDPKAFKGTFGSMGLYDTDPATARFSDPRKYVYNDAATYQGTLDNDVISDTVNSIVAAKYDGETGKVTVELPLGSYWVHESAAPTGYTRSRERFLVRFVWEAQENQYTDGEMIAYDDGKQITYKYFLASSISPDGKVETSESLNPEWERVVRKIVAGVPVASKDVTLTFEQKDEDNISVSQYYNSRVRNWLRITKYSAEDKTSLIEGVEFTLYTKDDIYYVDRDGNKTYLFHANDMVAVAVSDTDGVATFACDLPARGLAEEWKAGLDVTSQGFHTTGRYYIKETNGPSGVLLSPETVSFTVTGDNTFEFDEKDIVYSEKTGVYASSRMTVLIEGKQYNRSSHVVISKKNLTNSEELPGAALRVEDTTGKIVRSWISGETPEEIRGLDVNRFGSIATEFDLVNKDGVTYYNLIEEKPADGYTTAEDITFCLVEIDQAGLDALNAAMGTDYKSVADLPEQIDWNYVYVWMEPTEDNGLTTAQWKLVDANTVTMFDDTTKVKITKFDITTKKELPGATLTITEKETGKLIEEWVSKKEPHYIEAKLIAGVEYVLTETHAPSGYKVAKPITFKVNDDGSVWQTVNMYDARRGGGGGGKDEEDEDKGRSGMLRMNDKTGEVGSLWMYWSAIALLTTSGFGIYGRLVYKRRKSVKR